MFVEEALEEGPLTRPKWADLSPKGEVKRCAKYSPDQAGLRYW